MEHKVTEHELVGGAKLLVINLPVAVSFALDIYTRSGYRFANPAHFELPHLLEHLAFEGNELYPDALAFKAEMEKDGTYFNATTGSFFNDYYYIALPGELKRIIELGLAQVFQPLLTEAAISHEKETVTNELKGYREDNYRTRGYGSMQVLFGKGWPSWTERIAGLANVSSEDLRAFHQTNYTPSNVRFVLSGHFSRPRSINR